MKKILLLAGLLGFSFSVNAQNNTEDVLLKRFADATQARDLKGKCRATKDLLVYYQKIGNKNRVAMAQGILKRDCKRYS